MKFAIAAGSIFSVLFAVIFYFTYSGKLDIYDYKQDDCLCEVYIVNSWFTSSKCKEISFVAKDYGPYVPKPIIHTNPQFIMEDFVKNGDFYAFSIKPDVTLKTARYRFRIKNSELAGRKLIGDMKIAYVDGSDVQRELLINNVSICVER